MPRLVAADAAFYSNKNEAAARARRSEAGLHSQSLDQERQRIVYHRRYRDERRVVTEARRKLD
jgi:hypothetical protein